ncbi:hypothetical protein GE300_13410 [Rhodobacteraceae bacterium 2CG4]|uniref:KfrA N-terminal DNA-binding domain-containing protein n=1 Tax=Halovulum marinum TaxID=2662447 RepID=A0A6L5Z200_9RHOB|nr:DNA-binding protein [Halovulum marinum]MSU90601.1 hypothetical protein [Halovulum marinum]
MARKTPKMTAAQIEKKVGDAISELEKEGKRPTYANVRDQIGGGSFRDLGPIIKSVIAKREAREKAESEVPDMPEDVAELATAIWEGAYRCADAVAAADRRSHAEEVKRLQEEIREREGDIAAAEDDLDKMTERAEAAEEIQTTLEAELVELRLVVAGLEGRLMGRQEASKDKKEPKGAAPASPDVRQISLFDEPDADDAASSIANSESDDEGSDDQQDDRDPDLDAA